MLPRVFQFLVRLFARVFRFALAQTKILKRSADTPARSESIQRKAPR